MTRVQIPDNAGGERGDDRDRPDARLDGIAAKDPERARQGGPARLLDCQFRRRLSLRVAGFVAQAGVRQVNFRQGCRSHFNSRPALSAPTGPRAA